MAVIAPEALPRFGYDEQHDLFRAGVRAFIEREVVPHDPEWEQAGIVDKSLFRAAGRAGYLGYDVPKEYGGGGIADFRYNAIFNEEATLAGVANSVGGIVLHNDACIPYFLDATNDEQKARWLPGICDGSLMTAVAMTEPSGGSDLGAMRTTAVRDGDDYVIHGSKIFITGGFNFDLLVLACKTDPTQRARGISLIVVENGTPGLERGRKLEKIGQRAIDTAELFFNDLRVPVANRLGEEGSGFAHLLTKLARERIATSVGAVAHAEAAFRLGLNYAKEREAFGQPIGSFQHNRFVLAEMRTEIDIARVFVDHQIEALNQGRLSAEMAAEAKWWCTELCKKVVDQCLQLHGGYGYMEEYPIARAWRDARVMTIYGGTTEIMKEIIGRSLGV